MLDDPDIDAVIIATPNHWHALATVWALEAGKHVFVEKPSSHTVWEGRKMIEVAARTGKVVQTGFMNRSRPAVKDAIAFLHAGGIGPVFMARGCASSHGRPSAATRTVRWRPERSTGSRSAPRHLS